MKMQKWLLALLVVFMAVGVVVAQDGTQPEPDLPELITVILGVLAPMIVQTVTRNVTNELYRYLIALVLSAVIGVLALVILGVSLSLTPEIIIKVFAYASVSYKMFWKPIWNKPNPDGLPGKFAAKPTTYFKKA